MKTPPATPYLLPADEAVADHPWTTADGRPLPELLEHWDPFTDIEVLRSLDVDLDAVRESCQLDGDSSFALIASWHSTRTRLSGVATSIELGPDLTGLIRAPLTMQVPGTAAGGRLDLRTRLVLRYPGRTPSPISPRREGATLWVQETRIALEGASSRFPITAVDFEAVATLPSAGSWALEWNPNQLDAPVLGGLRLLVNIADEVLLGALRSGSSDPRMNVVRSFVMFDVARTLVHGALNNEQFVDEPEAFEDGTVGRMVFEMLTMYWCGMPIRVLSARARDEPSRLDAELQANLGVLR